MILASKELQPGPMFADSTLPLVRFMFPRIHRLLSPQYVLFSSFQFLLLQFQIWLPMLQILSALYCPLFALSEIVIDQDLVFPHHCDSRVSYVGTLQCDQEYESVTKADGW